MVIVRDNKDRQLYHVYQGDQVSVDGFNTAIVIVMGLLGRLYDPRLDTPSSYMDIVAGMRHC